MSKNVFDYLEEHMARPTYIYVPRGKLFLLALSICLLWGLAAVAWNGIFRILSVFLLLISVAWSSFVYKFWRIYYSPLSFALLLCMGAGLVILLKYLGG